MATARYHHEGPRRGEAEIWCDAESELPEIMEGLEQYYDWLESDPAGRLVHPGHKARVERLLVELQEGARPE